MTTQQQILDFYAGPTAMTAGGKHAPQLDGLPREMAAVARAVQGLVVHEYVASAYGITIPDERRSESHIRPVEGMLDRFLAHDDAPLAVVRPVDKRLVGVCHHFALLFVAILRAQGVPARYRCGFGSYFNPPYFEDHVVGEYWEAAASRWIVVDAQLDELWRRQPAIDFDPLDVPRDRFITAGDAWAQCRAGAADPSKFGIFVGDLRGLWFIAAALVRDVAALNKMEMLPWDVWGAMPPSDDALSDDQLALFDGLAALTRAPDASFEELRTLYEGDRLHVPATVFNAVRQRPETIG